MACLMIFVNVSPAFALTREEERKIGRQFYLRVKSKLEIVQDHDINAYINNLGQKILKPLGPRPFKYKFFIINDDSINAFAVPAGYVFLNSGLIKAYTSEGELAATVAHEIAHVTSRHLAKRIKRSQKLSLATAGVLLAGIFLGGPIGQAVAMGSIGASAQAYLKYSRDDESESDRKGLDYLVNAGYDPMFMLDSFKILLRTPTSGLGDVPSYLKTHPGLFERMAFVEMWARRAKYKGVKGRGNNQAFLTVQAKITAKYSTERFAADYFNKMKSEGSNVKLAYYGMALLKKRQQDIDAARGYYLKALELEPSDVGVLTDLGALLFQKGEYVDAQKYLQRAIILDPDAAGAQFYMARVLQEQGSLSQAKDYYLRIVFKTPQNEQILYNLGIIYGKLGELAKAHYHTGRYFQETGRSVKAMYHFEKAEKKLAGKSSPLSVKIDNVIKQIKKDKAGNRL